MTDETNTSKQPSHYAYMVRERKGDTPIWTRIGAAWTNKDGKGINIQLDAVPLNGSITLRLPSDKKD